MRPAHVLFLGVAAGLAWGFGCIGSPSGGAVAPASPDGAVDGADVRPDGGGDLDAAQVAVVDGGDADAVATVDAGAPWKLYSNATTQPTVWNVIGLDVAWSGPNAPPPRGIMAVTQLSDFPRLMVWADDGKFYVRDAGGWRAPLSTATTFPALAGRDFRGVGHKPSLPGTTPANFVEALVFIDNPTAIQYNYTALDAVQYALTVTMTNEAGPFGAPKASKKMRWAIRSWDPLQYGTAAYLADYSGYDNDAYVYFYDATPAPTNKWLFADAPLFAGKTNVPPAQNIMAGWRDEALSINYLIVR